MESLPTVFEVEEDLVAAQAAARAAESFRRHARRRTKKRDPERQKNIAALRGSLLAHGSILRSHLKRSDHHAQPYTSPIRRTIKRQLAALRYERRQLNKMLP